ncbi:MAG: ABC transporter substrate-binding protein [Betaproteobacteria bacterium]
MRRRRSSCAATTCSIEITSSRPISRRAAHGGSRACAGSYERSPSVPTLRRTSCSAACGDDAGGARDFRRGRGGCRKRRRRYGGDGLDAGAGDAHCRPRAARDGTGLRSRRRRLAGRCRQGIRLSTGGARASRRRRFDLETIVGLAPDLVVTWPWTSPVQVAWLRRRGIAVFEADAATVAGIADDVERIGALAGTSEVANAAASALRGRIARIARAHAGVAPLRVFYQVADAPIYTLGGRHIVSRAIEACGGVNVFGALSLPAPQVGVEGVIAANPQVIIAGTEGAKFPPWLAAWRRWPAIDAVRRHALYAVDANWLHRPGPRFVDGVAQLCDVIAQARGERDAGGSIMSPVSRAQLPVLPGDPDRHSR